MPHLHIIGGGLAGLAAALASAEAGRAVTLYEAGPVCGGRCRSYFDRALGCRIDNGNHLLLSGNDSVMDFLTRIGARDTLRGPDRAMFPFIDVASGARWTVRPNAGRVPWWVFSAARGVPGARLADYADLLKLRGAAPEDTVAGLLKPTALYRRLIEPLAVSALNTPAQSGSARLFWAVIAGSLARGGARCVPLYPREGLSESFVDPALARLRALGVQIKYGHRVAALDIADAGVRGFSGPDGAVTLAGGDQLILAVPASVAGQLVPGLTVPDAFEAIVNLHFRVDIAPPPWLAATGFAGLVGGLAEWVFLKPGIVSVTISAANRLAERTGEDLAGSIWRELCVALDLRADSVARLPPWRLLREKRATFAATPAQQMRRTSATAGLRNVALAGDWTDTGLPATIEGAIRSGFAAAHQIGGGATRL